MTPAAPQARFYDELSEWWPLFSPPDHYGEEAADLLPRLGRFPPGATATLLELGAGGGSLASHLRPHFTLTLTDRSAGMQAVSRTVNPDAEHIVGDMRTLRLGRLFDVVLVHDAIMYATVPADVEATLRTAALHCRPGGTVAVLPDFVRETFVPGTDDGGEDAPDGRGFRYLEWRWDPDPADDTYVVDYAFLLREATGAVRVVHDPTWKACFRARAGSSGSQRPASLRRATSIRGEGMCSLPIPDSPDGCDRRVSECPAKRTRSGPSSLR